jgi:hypothetical protein
MRINYRFFLLLFLFVQLSNQLQSQFALGTNWSYFKGSAVPAAGWNSTTFDDSDWLKGNAPFRYGVGTGGTVLNDMRYKYTTFYLRKKFTVLEADSMLDKVNFQFNYDDGFRLWINGSPVLAYNAPISNDTGSVATANIGQFSLSSIVMNASDANIKNGENTIAVVVYNSNKSTSSDIYFDISSSITIKEIPKPKAPEVKFNMDGGYYTSAFNVIISTLKAGDTIKYTLDCSDPDSSLTATEVTSPFTLQVKPTGMAGRPNTPAVVVRAAVIKKGYSSTNSETRTYIFLENVKAQTNPGTPWPLPYSGYNDQKIDYDVDSRIINDGRYMNSIDAAFKAIPTVSVVTHNNNLFDQNIGIYMNAMIHGEDWERPASIELVNTDNTEAFSSGVGLRIRGGWSRRDNNPKHAFRLFFKDQYGKKSLKYPVFGEKAAQSFDKLDLRCAQNYSWSFYNDKFMTYAQDEFCRDAQGLTESLYTRSRYCHLFLNGMYWGLYEFMERPEANYAESYRGNDKDDYDVIKVNDPSKVIEATNGNMVKWTELFMLAKNDFTDNAYYYKIQGLNNKGAIDTTLTKLVDVDNLIDYMINIFYSANFDAPLSQFRNNNTANNFYAIINRNAKREGFNFIVHDAEHTFNWGKPSEANNKGVSENRVNLELKGMTEPTIENFTPQWLHYKLTSNAAYRLRFADLAYKRLTNNGIFTPTVVETNFRKRAKEIDMAIIAESARWGDSNGSTLRTKDDDWIPAVNNTISQFVYFRTDTVIMQLKNANLWALLNAPEFKNAGVLINSQDVVLNQAMDVNISNPNATGTLYYTIDGTDPRNFDGSLNSKAIVVSNNTKITIPYSLILKSRVLNGSIWSPVHEVLFTNTKNRDKIKITEIQYHSINYGSIPDNELEFIELKNTGTVGVDLGGCKLDSAVSYTFPKGTIINPKGFIVIASDKNGFEVLYKIPATGEFGGSLSNEGERIVLFDESNTKIIDMKYGIEYPWSIKVNGSGFSLVAKDFEPIIDASNASYWRTSRLQWGSPFADDSTFTPLVTINNITTPICKVYPNPACNQLYIDGGNNLVQQVQLYDINGRMVYNSAHYGSRQLLEIPLQSLNVSNGMFMVKIFTPNSVEVQKVMIRK